ncbi:hypothetical protein HK105_204180 [Polyrhizophydium stewartii]|uniref:Ankyrin repeat protein n=1 Tax=Polyrhizophydium stewartii TaxID=2732419 RepID=A0ABR4N9A4_9FUNG
MLADVAAAHCPDAPLATTPVATATPLAAAPPPADGGAGAADKLAIGARCGGDRADLAARLQRLPFELRAAIFHHAGPLTRCLHGELPLPMTRSAASLVVADLFRLDAVHLVDHPRVPRNVPVSWEMMFVHSPAMLEAAAVFPHPPLDDPYTALDLGGRPNRTVLHTLTVLVADLAPDLAAMAAELLAFVMRCAEQPFEPGFGTRLLNCAAGLGDLALVRSLVAVGLRPSPTAAFANGHLAVARYLCDTCPNIKICIDGALRNGHAGVVRHLCSRFSAPPPPSFLSHTAVDAALAAGHGRLVRELLAAALLHAHPGLRHIKDSCARHGHLDLLLLAIELGIGGPLTAAAMDGAAERGHLDMVRWLHTNTSAGCTDLAMKNAIASGHLHIARWLHATKGMPFSAAGLVIAANRGHTETFRAIADLVGGELSEADLDKAAGAGHFWIVEHFAVRCAPTAGLSHLLRCALAGGHLALAQWLAATGRAVTAPDMMDGVAAGGHLDCAEWLHAQLRLQPLWQSPHSRSPSPRPLIPATAFDGAVKNGHLAVVRFFVETCGRPITTTSCITAVSFGRANVLRYLYDGDSSAVDWDGVIAYARAKKLTAFVAWVIERDIRPDSAGSEDWETVHVSF